MTHAEAATLSPSVTVTGPGYHGPCTTPQALTASGALTTSAIDLAGVCELRRGHQLADLAVTYRLEGPADAEPATGRLDGVELSVTYRPVVTTTPDRADGDFADVDEARAEDGTAAVAGLTPGNPTASVRLDGFVPTPRGAVLSGARLRVVHGEDGDATAPVLHVEVPAAGSGPDCQEDVTLPVASGGDRTDVVPLPCPLTTAAQVAGLVVTVRAALAAGGSAGTSRVDAVTLALQADPLRLRAVSGCAAAAGPSGSGCAILATTDDGPAPTRLVLHGSVHAPSAAVDLRMHGLDTDVVEGTVVARTIRLDLTPADGYDGPLVGPPPHIAGVTFVAYPARTDAPTAADASGSAPFGEATKGLAIDAATADAAFSDTATTATMELSGFSATTPAGPDSAVVLRLAHQEDGEVADLHLRLHLPASPEGPAVACDLEVPVHRDAGAPVTDQFDLSSPGAPQPCGLPAGRSLEGLSMTYTAKGAGRATAGLDGVQLDLLADPVTTATVTYLGERATRTEWRNLR